MLALERELQTYAGMGLFADCWVNTIYFGGGTPSLFSPVAFERMLSTIDRCWRVAPSVEITLEANPGTVDLLKLKALRSTGINRLSLGVQSFDEENLRALGRIHGPREAIEAIANALRAGFKNVNIDLIYALPGQTLEAWERDLQRALSLKPTHISAYNLTYEEGTPFHSWRKLGRLQPLDEDTELAMFTLTEKLLEGQGYCHYEISNYAQPSFFCRHNLGYWSSEPYVGVGAGAHGYSPWGGSQGWGFRWANERSPKRYLVRVQQNGHARASVEHLSFEQAAGEFIFLALRRAEGLDATRFFARFQKKVEQAFPVIGSLVAQSLLEPTEHGWRLSPRGIFLADSVFAEFL